MKKIFSIFLVIAMLVTTCVVSAAHYTDIDGHWAKNEIEAWSDYGVISGYDGKFSPNRFITRGEFAVVLNRLMGYQEESANTFSDLPDKFYTSSVLKLNKAGVMQGYDGAISPEASLTREEASVMICRALGINTADTMNRAFSDEADISSWSKGYINAMVNTGLLNGADGKLNPKNPIMRAEVVKILDNAVRPILKSGIFDNVGTDKILVISAGDVTVKNSEIKGKVIVTQGVTTGKLSFTDSKIQNSVVIDNDRSAFIELKNTTVANQEILKHKAIITDSAGGDSSSGGGGGTSGGDSGSDCSHTWNAGVVTKAPTTESTGIKTYTCTKCKKTKTETIAKLPASTNLPTITVSDVRAEAGDEITVPVSITKNVGLTGLTITFGYNTDVLTLTGSEEGEALNSLTLTRSGDLTANPVTFLWDGMDADSSNGNILLLKFKVADNAKAGTYTIDLTIKIACDENINPVDMAAVDGKVSVGTIDPEQQTIKVTFFEGFGKYAESVKEVELVLDSQGKARIAEGDIPTNGLPWNGYKKRDYMPSGYDDYNGKHEVKPSLWYINNGVLKPFDKSVVLTKDTDVYWLYKEFSLNALGTAITVRYDDDSRVMDSAKTLFDKGIPQLELAKDTRLPIYEKPTAAILGMVEETGLVDGNKKIKKIKFNLYFEDALTENVSSVTNNDGDFEIVPENLETLKAICDELENITFDAILDAESGTAIDAMVSLVGYDICEDIFNDVRDEYCDELTALISEVENGTEMELLPSTFTMVFNPIDDIFKPLFAEAEEEVISGFGRSVRYDDNPYLQYIVEEFDIFDELLTRSGRETDKLTAYQLKDLIACAECMTKLLIAADDALCWYDGYGADYEEVCSALFAEMKIVCERFEDVLTDSDYNHKLPDSIKEALEGVLQISDMLLDFEIYFNDAISNYIDIGTDDMINVILYSDEVVQEKVQELIELGDLYSKIDEFKNSSMGQMIDEEFIDDFVDLIQNIARNGLSDYEVPTSDITTIGKYEVDIGDYTFAITIGLEG